jgi:hypothetical protein
MFSLLIVIVRVQAGACVCCALRVDLFQELAPYKYSNYYYYYYMKCVCVCVKCAACILFVKAG